jgi:photosystem II stability/assembly factor-like uncharacterized protein
MTVVETHRIEDLRLLPFSKVRLLPGAFPVEQAPAMRPLMAITPMPEIQGMVSQVSGDTLWKYISQLSGREPAPLGDHTLVIPTRYSYNSMVDSAAQYLYERFENYGIDVDYHYYTVGKHSFYSVAAVDDQHVWVTGSSQKIFKTSDGGLTWTKQVPGAIFQSFWGICFLDTLEGWIAGTSGNIFHTTNGGASWANQATPTGVTLREICFLDSVTGWVVGYAGIILQTTDGGATWTSIPSGTSYDLYGLHFQAPDRGWACGENGIIRFWDGVSWTAQTSGTSEYLLDIHFGDDDTGWIVGGGRTVLTTSDGGTTWSPQTAPTEVDPYLKGVCFTDTLNGWAVGLSGGIIHTSDGGVNWEAQSSGTLFGLRWVRFIDELEGWATGYGCATLHTADGGATWENQTGNLPSGALLSLRNVVATKPGAVSTDQVIICAHYDCTSNDPDNLAPGADDNASGTAGVVEAARVLAEYPFEKTVKFLCVSGEEQGLYGSGEYATDAKFAGDVITGVFNLDMIGYVNSVPEDADLIGDPSSEWLVDFAVDCATAYVPGLPTLKVIDENSVYSDHASFWRAGYHAFYAIEDDNLTYPHYHTTGDTLGNLTQSFAEDCVKLGVATIAELAVPHLTSGLPHLAGADLVTSAYPNPFTASTKISFALALPGRVKVTVFDVEGRVVNALSDGMLPAGRQQLVWQGDDDNGQRVSPGIYFANVEADGIKASAKVIVLR